MTPLHAARYPTATTQPAPTAHGEYPSHVTLSQASGSLLQTRTIMLAHLVRSLDQSDIVRSLAILLSLQGAIAVAMVSWSPRLAALTNEESRLFLLVATAACAAAVTLAPALLALLLPTSRTTRIALGLGQTLMAVMFFYLTGDHIRTRTGMVTALALLALNIDWVFIVSAEGSYAAELAANSEPEVKPLSAAASRTMELADKLEKALVNGGLSLVYQPIFRGNQQMVAVEALARWTDPEEGSIPPSEFIPAAEATGLIVPFSDWVLREACQQMAQWTTIDPTIERIAVNVSVKHIWCADFVQTVQRILIHTGLPAHRLELEVTESALVADFETVKRHLMHLRRLGVRISIDDFGTGYSSLSRVGELNADCLKVDRQFVQNASESARGAAVVQAIVDMAHSLNLSVIAEGVETHEQMAMLRTMGCDEVQGFLLARPQPATAITTTLLEVAVTREADRLHLVANHP